VRLYNKVLTTAEIARLYNLGTGSHQNTTITPPNLASGLVGHWTFDGKDMISNIADTSGQGNALFLTNFTSTTTALGVIGQALSFNGTSNVASRADVSILKPANDMAISWWVMLKRDPADAGHDFVFAAKANASAPFYSYQCNYTTADSLDCVWANSGGSTYNTHSSATLSTGVWYHLVYVKSGSAGQIYVNGVDTTASSDTHSGTIFDSSGSFNVGAFSSGQKWVGGIMDDVRIYNRALTQAEITQLYKLGH